MNRFISILTSVKLLGCYLLCLLSITNSQAQKKQAFSARLITHVPFSTFAGGIVVIRAQLAGYPDTLNFIMDTGSAGISLDSTTCVRMNIIPVLTDKTIRGVGGVRRLSYVKNQSLLLGQIKVDSLDFHVGNYEILSSEYGDRIDGVIGDSFYTRYIVSIDYDINEMSVYSKGNFNYPKGGFALKPTFSSLPVDWAAIHDIRDVKARFFFDTGAGLCVLLNSDFIGDSSVLNHEKKPLPIQAQGMGGKVMMHVTTIKEFRLGPYRFKNLPAHIFEDVYHITSYPYIAGLIGNDVLRRFNIILNYDRQIFYLTPNSHFNDPFDYSYTGLDLYRVEGEIRVGDVMIDSPADKAGFKTDDVVISVNENMSNNLQLYKSMLQNTGGKVRVVVYRSYKGNTELTIKVKSIL
ncbi:MAG TPA: aspartyl protease family protein [Puia sp.]|nr:aspartyl protease family protein [Puia sp.]